MLRSLAPLTLILVCSCATAVAPVSSDALTVSGRYDLPTADTTRVAGLARVVGVSADASVADALSLDAEGLDALLTAAFMKTLDNHGYLAGAETAAPADLTAAIPSIEIVDSETGFVATAKVEVAAQPSSMHSSCFTDSGSASFTALAPQSASNGHRTFAIVAGSLLAAASGPGGSPTVTAWMTSQMTNADLNDDAANARRDVSGGEGVAPGGGLAAERFAAINALQLAFADYIVRLPRKPDCLPPQAGADTTVALTD